jgi:hypothetical protein
MELFMETKILMLEVGESNGGDYGKYRFYSKDVAMVNIAISVGITPEVSMQDKDILPCDNEGYYLIWCGDSSELLINALKIYFTEWWHCKDNGWNADSEDWTYIKYMIEHKDEFGLTQFFQEDVNGN